MPRRKRGPRIDGADGPVYDALGDGVGCPTCSTPRSAETTGFGGIALFCARCHVWTAVPRRYPKATDPLPDAASPPGALATPGAPLLDVMGAVLAELHRAHERRASDATETTTPEPASDPLVAHA